MSKDTTAPISKHKINIPTPIMGRVRTPLRQFASCVLVDVDDSSILSLAVIWLIGRYVAQRAGIGIQKQAESVVSTVKSGVEKFSTQVLFLSLKSLNQLSGVVHKNGIGWVSCPLPNLAPRNRRHHCSQEQQGHRR